MSAMKMVIPLMAIIGAQQLATHFGLPTAARLLLQVVAALALPRFVARFFPSETLVGKKAPSIDGMTYIHGTPVKLGQGRVTVVEFWATWCPPCRTSIPHLSKLYETCKEQVDFVGISNEQAEPVRTFLETEVGKEFTYPCAIDPARAVSGYPVEGIPSAFVVDGEGIVVWQGHPMQGLDAAVQTAITNLSAKGKAAAASS
eukprot:CAMPEP_0180202916 /NCGR_PEP_ID=MMETSP0987-20121128/7568_1 /TAXON_ID=697907 /ORGANISM="non described non described, Strain CCMP2293" /LENGTH=200 /DNA_ID=CAMNT_0022158241 /DNA_START=29 /DNA_END=631 /DNA_ORIENTATION=-